METPHSNDSEKTGPHPVDTHVGAQLRLARKVRGMSQEALAEKLGITFQQVQKYERGANRISSSKLYEAAQTLGVPINVFFDGLSPTSSPDAPSAFHPEQIASELLSSTPGLKLAQGFLKIRSLDVRKALANLVATMGDLES